MVATFSLEPERPGLYVENGIAAFFRGARRLPGVRPGLNGRFARPALLLLLAAFVPYFDCPLTRHRGPVALVGRLLYLPGFVRRTGGSLRLAHPPLVKGLYVAGIGLIVSRPVDSLAEFLHWRVSTPAILPTYYLAHLSITASVLRRSVSNRELPTRRRSWYRRPHETERDRRWRLGVQPHPVRVHPARRPSGPSPGRPGPSFKGPIGDSTLESARSREGVRLNP